MGGTQPNAPIPFSPGAQKCQSSILFKIPGAYNGLFLAMKVSEISMQLTFPLSLSAVLGLKRTYCFKVFWHGANRTVLYGGHYTMDGRASPLKQNAIY